MPYAYQADLLNPRYIMDDSVVEINLLRPSTLWIGAGVSFEDNPNIPGGGWAWITVNGDILGGSKQRIWGNGVPYSVILPYEAAPGRYLFRTCFTVGNLRVGDEYRWVLVTGERRH